MYLCSLVRARPSKDLGAHSPSMQFVGKCDWKHLYHSEKEACINADYNKTNISKRNDKAVAYAHPFDTSITIPGYHH